MRPRHHATPLLRHHATPLLLRHHSGAVRRHRRSRRSRRHWGSTRPPLRHRHPLRSLAHRGRPLRSLPHRSLPHRRLPLPQCVGANGATIGHSRRGRPCGFDEALPGEHGQQPCGGLVRRAGGAVVDSARRPTAHWSLGRRHAQLRGVTLLVCVAAGVGRIDGVCGHVAPLRPGHADWGIVFHLGRPFGGRFCCLGEHDHCAPKRTLLALEFGAAGPSSRALVVLAHDANALPQPRGLLPDGAERLHLLLRVRLHSRCVALASLFGKALAAARRAFLKSRSTGSSQRNSG